MKNEELTEQHLLMWARVREGDRTAFDKLYLATVQDLFNYGIKIHPDRELVKDRIQELFILLWNKRDTLNIDRSIKNYLYLSLRRSILKRQQNAFVSDLQSVQELEHPSSYILNPNIADDSNKLNQEKMNEAIGALTKRQKEAIFLKYYEGMNSEEMAEIMNLKINAVYKLISTGIKRMRDYINTPS